MTDMQQRLQEDVTEIKQDVKNQISEISTISEHLRQLNGKVAEHHQHLNNTCPQKHDEIETKINNINKTLYKGIGIVLTVVLLLSMLASIFTEEIRKFIMG